MTVACDEAKPRQAPDTPGEPLAIAGGCGARVRDVNGREYVDCVCGDGALIVGHAHPAVAEAVARAGADGADGADAGALEAELAERLAEALPSADTVHLAASAADATAGALRLARAFTGGTKVLACGNSHGEADMPAAPYNDLAAVESAVAEAGDDLACILVEPIASTIGVVPPAPGFLPGLRDLCDQCGALLVFDETTSGFRAAYGGAQSLYGVTPDLTALGKIIGGGLPIGAVAGRREIMETAADKPAGPASGSAGLSAGLATLDALREPEVYEALEATSARLALLLAGAALDAGLEVQLNRVGSMMTLFFAPVRVTDARSAARADADGYGRFFAAMLERGVHLPSSQFSPIFLSTAHTSDDLQQIAEAAARVLLG